MSRRGHNRERQVRKHLEEHGYLVVRAAGSLGDVDLVAMKRGRPPLLIEVKSTIGKYDHFSPADREELRQAAELGGCDCTLAWWPSHGKLQWISSDQWPKVKAVTSQVAA